MMGFKASPCRTGFAGVGEAGGRGRPCHGFSRIGAGGPSGQPGAHLNFSADQAPWAPALGAGRREAMYLPSASTSRAPNTLAPYLSMSVWGSLTIQSHFSVLAKTGSVTSMPPAIQPDRKSTRLNSSHQIISYAVFCLKKKKKYAFRS